MRKVVKFLEERSVLSFASLIMFFTLILASLHISGKGLALLQMFTLILSTCASLVEKKVFKQQLAIIIIFAVMFVGGVVDPYSDKSYKKLVFLFGIAMIISASALITRLIKNSGRGKARNYSLLIIVIPFLAISLLRLHTFPIFDSSAYFKGCGDIKNFAYIFDFQATHTVDYLLAFHESMGYSIFVLIGELFTPCLSEGIVFINIVIASISVGCFYRMLRRFGDENSWLALAGTAVYAFSPFVLGMVQTISTDIPSIWFWVIMLDMLLEEKHLLFLFFSWAFVCTKEPNVIVYCFMILGILLYDRKKIFCKEGVKRILLYAVAPVFWLLYYFAPKRNSYYASTDSLFSATGEHTFGFTWINTWVKIKQIFILNFNWIAIVIIVCILVNRIYKKKLFFEREDFAIWFSLIGNLIFNIFYLDYWHPRYIALASVTLLCGVVVFFLKNSSDLKKKLSGGILICLSALLFIQSFYTIDVLSKKINYSLNYSKNSILISPKEFGFSDLQIYNGEFYSYQRVIEKALDFSDFKSDDCLIIPGYPISYTTKDCINWNRQTKRLQTAVSNENVCNITMCNSIEEALRKGSRTVVIYPYSVFGDAYDELALGNSEAKIVDSKPIQSETCSAYVYVIER